MSININLRRLFKLSFLYFISSIKNFSTWVLIIFNVFLLLSFIKDDTSSGSVILSYLIQISISIFLFGILLFSLKSFKTRGKSYSGKGIKTGLAIFVLGIWVFYGIAIGILLSGTLRFIHKIEFNFFIGILIILFSIIIHFIIHLKTERERLESTELVKTFFEPAGNLFPIYLSVILLIVFKGQIGILIIIVKTFADIIINSPLNAENPFIFQILGGNEKLNQ
jgi:hypothetical protein